MKIKRTIYFLYYWTLLTRKVDLHFFSLVKKFANEHFWSYLNVIFIIYFTDRMNDVRENKRFTLRFSTSCRKYCDITQFMTCDAKKHSLLLKVAIIIITTFN